MLRSRRTAIWFLGPHLTLFFVWTVLPLVGIAVLSFYDWNLLGDRRFAALENYRELLHDRLFWEAMWNTARFALALTPLALAGGLPLAVALNPPQRGKNILLTVFYAPGVISGVAAATAGAWILNVHYGILNAVLTAVHLPRQDWLDSRTAAIWALTGATLWMRVGFCMVVYLAGLQEIPVDLYEAARVDGAGTWNRFRYITWPMLHRSTLLLTVLNIVFSFHIFDLAYIMTAGGPGFSTTMLVQYFYESGFALQREGYAAAVALVLFASMLTMTFFAWLIQRRSAR